ncbi:MAG: hypothetical protein JNL41_11595 [Phenylobacterium sp.]|uniref:hypothetical protein n=1 Tax=Phenylobacterium sp. TaxID=1871053 RepID=UPI001A48E88A|nr:hypothetical protein [Phenylobacterium sp.]MBL8554913.1 hypothetical protein [Phenylobacterium sp.]
MSDLRPTHLDQRDPGKPGVRSIREEVDREIDAYQGLESVVLLAPEDQWDEFIRVTGAADRDGETRYRGVTVRRGAVTAVVAQEGF